MFAKMPVLIDQPTAGVAIAQLLDGLSHQAAGFSIEQSLRLLRKSLHREIKKHRVSSLTTWKSATLAQKKFDVQPAIIFRERRYPAGPKVQLPSAMSSWSISAINCTACSRFRRSLVHT
ncbi:MAG: hypothetical protein R3C56_11775 [Pirellulaceae bacterium]